jgi:hypothetical protein
MKGRMLHPFLQRVAALALLGIALGVAASSIAYPLLEAIAERDAASSRLARYQRVLSDPTVGPASYNVADLAAARVDEPDAQLLLQASVDRLARGAGLAVQSTQPLAAEHLGEIGKGAWLELTFAADLRALTDFMTSLDAERPLLLVRRLEIERGEGVRPDIFLRAKIQIGQAWRASGDAT